MFEILTAIAVFVMTVFCVFIYLRWREEAKSEEHISDMYIYNNEDVQREMTITVRYKNKKIIEGIKKMESIKVIEQNSDDEVVIIRKIPIYTSEQLVEKIKQEESGNGKDN